jgi:hypothetical protein
MYQQKPAWYFNKKTQEFIENKDSENRENLPKDYYSDVGVHPYKMFKDFCCIPYSSRIFNIPSSSNAKTAPFPL